jgi:septin family protein
VRTTQRPQDSYIHLVLYFINPETVNRRPALSSRKVSGGEDLDMLLCDVDRRCIRRLAEVANVLPVSFEQFHLLRK